MNNHDDMQTLVSRTEQLIDALSGAMLSTAEAAAERIALAAQVAQVQQRMAAFAAVLDAIGAQKEGIAGRLTQASPAMKRLLGRQLEVLTAQELSVLERAGLDTTTARSAVQAVDASGHEATTYRRDGRRFVRLAADTADDVTGNGAGNGTAARE